MALMVVFTGNPTILSKQKHTPSLDGEEVCLLYRFISSNERYPYLME